MCTWATQPIDEICTWARQPISEMCTWATQPKDILYMGIRQLLMEDLCVGVGQLQLGVRNLPLEDLCVGDRQLLVDGCYSLELDNSQWIDESNWN
jgi:hypothetical protein